jgi:hypothetical protein
VLQARTNEKAILKIPDVELLAFASDAKPVVFQQLIPISPDLRGEQDALIERGPGRGRITFCSFGEYFGAHRGYHR